MVLGPPLSGKSGQCQLMSHRLGLPHIQVGALLQAKSAAGDEALQSILQGGGLVPDSMYIDAVRERLHHNDCLQSGWLLDGFPHTLPQVCHGSCHLRHHHTTDKLAVFAPDPR